MQIPGDPLHRPVLDVKGPPDPRDRIHPLQLPLRPLPRNEWSDRSTGGVKIACRSPRPRGQNCTPKHKGDNEAVYVAFVRRAKGNKIARRVKTADILDNLNASLLSALTEKDMRRMNRYLAALRELRDAEA